MKEVKSKVQHYIPQCYLRHFSLNKKFLFVYDKRLSKSFSSSTAKVGYIDDFYELPEKFIKNLSEIPSGTSFFEKEFFAKNIEAKYCQLLGIINSKAKSWLTSQIKEEILNEKEKSFLAQLIAIQYLRMPDIREKYTDARKKADALRFDIIKSFIEYTDPNLKGEIKNIQLSYDEAYNPILHSEMYSDEEMYLNIADLLIKKYWIYFVSESNDFYTSDYPIIIKPHLPGQLPYWEGFGMKGAEIILPLGSSVLLTCWDPNFIKDFKNPSDSFCPINEKEKREYNCLQYMFSNEQTYSYHDDFKLISLLKEINYGKEFRIKRPTILVNGK